MDLQINELRIRAGFLRVLRQLWKEKPFHIEEVIVTGGALRLKEVNEKAETDDRRPPTAATADALPRLPAGMSVGLIQIDFAVETADGIMGNLDFSLADLHTDSGGDLRLCLAVRHPSGAECVFSAPLRIEMDAGTLAVIEGAIDLKYSLNPEFADESLTGTLSYQPGVEVDRLFLRLDQLNLDTLMPMIAVFGEDPPSDFEPPPTADHAIWQPILRGGTIPLYADLSANTVIYEEKELSNLAMPVRIHPEHIVLDDARFEFAGSSGIASAELDFSTARTVAYQLTGNLGIPELHTRSLLASFAGETRGHYLDTRLDLNITIRAAAPRLEAMIADSRVDFVLKAGGGTLRLSDPERPQPGRELLAGAGQLLGALSPRLGAIPAIYERLQAVRFDRLELYASGDPSGSVRIDQFLLLSPDLRLQGSGAFQFTPDRPIHATPMQLRLNLGARAELGRLMDNVGILRAQPDESGFRPAIRTIDIGGTIGGPRTTDLWDLILR